MSHALTPQGSRVYESGRRFAPVILSIFLVSLVLSTQWTRNAAGTRACQIKDSAYCSPADPWGRVVGLPSLPSKKKKRFPPDAVPCPHKISSTALKVYLRLTALQKSKKLEVFNGFDLLFCWIYLSVYFYILYACSNQKPLNKTIENRNTLHSFKKIFYLFLERGEGRERGRETSMCGCSSQSPDWGHGL